MKWFGTQNVGDRLHVEEFSKCFKTIDNIPDTETSLVVSSSSAISTRGTVETLLSTVGGTRTDWINLPYITLDVTKERLLGIKLNAEFSGGSSTAFFSVEDLRSIAASSDLQALGVVVDCLPTSLPIDSSASISLSLIGAKHTVVSNIYPETKIRDSLQLSYSGNTYFTIEYIVETFGADANNSSRYSY
jgi:hypothetical protein